MDFRDRKRARARLRFRDGPQVLLCRPDVLRSIEETSATLSASRRSPSPGTVEKSPNKVDKVEVRKEIRRTLQRSAADDECRGEWRQRLSRVFSQYFLNLPQTLSNNPILLCVQAYEKARESVHAQKVIQGRGTMNK